MNNEDNIEFICSDCTEKRLDSMQEKLLSGEVSYKKGDYVKIKFVNRKSDQVEWMWVKVTSKSSSGKNNRGTLASEPIVVTNMQFGEPISFDDHEVAQIFNEQ